MKIMIMLLIITIMNITIQMINIVGAGAGAVGLLPGLLLRRRENLKPLPMNKWVPDPPSPWRKSSKRESCYGDRV